jgi:hypothetical protein
MCQATTAKANTPLSPSIAAMRFVVDMREGWGAVIAFSFGAGTPIHPA